MRVLMWSVTAFALATSIDAHYFDGRYVNLIARFVVNVWRHF
jgi:hypothetical protein